MSSPDSLVSGVVAAFAGIFISVILFFAAAIPIETFIKIMTDGTYYNIAGGWGGGYNDVLFFKSLMYVIICLPTLIGFIVLYLSAIKTQEYDVVSGESDPQYAPIDYRGQQ